MRAIPLPSIHNHPLTRPVSTFFQHAFWRERLYSLKINIYVMQYTIVLGPQDTGGFTARCVEIPGAVTLGVNKGEALANIKEAIELVREAQYEELQSTIHDIHSEIITINVNDVACS